jgi:hypothetical protein
MARLRPRSGSSRLVGQHKLLFVTVSLLVATIHRDVIRDAVEKLFNAAKKCFGAAKNLTSDFS